MPATPSSAGAARWPSVATPPSPRRATSSTSRSRSPISTARCAAPSSSPCSCPNLPEPHHRSVAHCSKPPNGPTFHSPELAGYRQRGVHHRRGTGHLAEPAETARRTHLRGDQVGRLVDVATVDRGGERPSSPRAGHLHVADGPLGVWGDDRQLLRVGGFAPLPAAE